MDMKEIIRTRKSVRTFFDGNFQTPLTDSKTLAILESVRWYPSAGNMQPCRIVKDGNKYHFYEQHKEGYRNAFAWDVQKIDMGIALCHFISVTNGNLITKNPIVNALNKFT